MSKVKLCFDAGHYKNYNQSKVFKSYYEGNKMWTLHLLVKKYLESNYSNVEIITTRDSIEKDLSLYSRGYKAKGSDGFYSFHSNASDDETVDRVVIIRGIGITSINSYAKELGDEIKKCMGVKGNTQIYERKNNSGGEYYGVLRGAKSAGIENRFIIEHSFHTNTKAAKFLYNDDNLEKLAKVEAEIIAKHHKLVKKLSTPIISSPDSTEWKNGSYNVKVKATANLNARKGRGTNNPIIYTIPKNETFKIGYVYNNWASTWDFKGQVLYVCCDYIENIR